MMFPEYRPRRLRKNKAFRAMVRETRLQISNLIYPMFVVPGKGVREPVKAMPGVERLSVDVLVEEAKAVKDLGLGSLLLFGIPEKKDKVATQAWISTGIVQRAVEALKRDCPDILVITDVCVCEYTSHGHCGLIDEKTHDVANDPTLELLQKVALSHARAGADMVAPSDMMDGRIGAIREILDEHGFEDVPIMSYAVKYASSFYGPFREAAESAPKFGDRRSYQMDPANQREALREATLDMEEGADIIMVKPAMPYLDIIQIIRQEFILPVAAYQVSGEYAMIKAAGANGWIDEEQVMMESLLSIKRAGADIILTYFAREVAKKLAA